MKKGLLWCLMIHAFFVSCQVFASDAPPEARKVAEEGMKNLLAPGRLYASDLQNFDRQAGLEKVVLGEGFEVFTTPPEKQFDTSFPRKLHSLVTSTNQWMFLVRTDGKPQTAMTVALSDLKWQPTQVLSSSLAKVLDDVLKQWPASSGYRYRLVLSHAGPTFLEISKDGMVAGFIPGDKLIRYMIGGLPENYDSSKLVDVADEEKILSLSGLRPPN